MYRSLVSRRYRLTRPFLRKIRRLWIRNGLLFFVCFAIVLLPSLFFIPQYVEAATIQELETALKSCQANWDRLNQRIRQVCPHGSTKNDVCDQIKDLIETDKKYRAERLGTPVSSTTAPKSEIESKETLCRYFESHISSRSCESPYSMADCAAFRYYLDTCKKELAALQAPRYTYPDPKSREFKQLDERIAQREQEYDACLKSAEKRDECFRLQGQLTSVDTACREIKQNLANAKTNQQPQQGPSGTVRIFVSGRLPNQVGKQATYQGRIESDARSGSPWYAYYWYLNGQLRTKGYNQTTFTFAIPQKGVNKVSLQVVKTNDNGTTWQNVGEASDSFYTEEKSNPWTQADQAGKARTRRQCKYADDSASSCTQYGKDAIAQNNENISLGCGYDKTNSIRFHGKEDVHSEWCKTRGKQQGAITECSARENQLDSCTSAAKRK